jgi:hypothetical protein
MAKAQKGKLPAPAPREQSEEFNEFLKASDIGPEGTEAQIDFTGNVRGPEDSEFGERIICEVRYQKKLYDFSVKTNNANYRLLHSRFGADGSKWRGKVGVIIKHFRNNDYIAVTRS